MASILLLNTSFQNRGDALMIHALQQRLGPGHDWSVTTNIAFKSRQETRRLQICLASDLPGETLKQRGFNAVVSLGRAAASVLPSAPTSNRKPIINAVANAPIRNIKPMFGRAVDLDCASEPAAK